MDKFELEKVLSSILEDYGFLDSIKVLNYNLNQKTSSIFGLFKTLEGEYNFSLDYNNNKEVEHLSWLKRSYI